VPFGHPDLIQADLEIQREHGTSVDFFQPFSYAKARVILHGSVLVAAESPRFTIHGTAGSYVKFGLDIQESALKLGDDVHSTDWGIDERDGILTTYLEDKRHDKTVRTERGNYLAYYEGVRDAIKSGASNPVPASPSKGSHGFVGNSASQVILSRKKSWSKTVYQKGA